MNKIPCAVIGVGYLGRFHAQKYKSLPMAELIAVCDANPDTCDQVAAELSVPAVYDYRDLFGRVKAVSIAASTQAHYQIAKDCLLAGMHVLVEKPITETVEQAEELIKIARKQGLKLQVGHLERFNAARLALDPHLTNPQFIDSQRLAPFNPRGSDVNVILDLMIHDIDLIQAMVNKPILHIDAHGTPILTKDIDIASARITFANHCVANVTASRVSFKAERKMRIFQPESYISLDFQNKEFAVFNKGEGELFPGIPDIIKHQASFEKGDALLEEIAAFLRAIDQNSSPLVTGVDGRNALATAELITQLIQTNLQQLYALN